ncbi:tyrosine-type recombinase/integrase [Pseudomonas shirazica]|nr:tyrosine-type recombinase/integrase [Pseudomonas shirazica]
MADHMVATVEREPMLGMLLMLMLSFGVRIGETRQARWENFDLEARVWIIPAETTKTRTRHVLPLTDALVQCLSDYRRWLFRNGLEGPWLFCDKRGRPLSDSLARAWVAAAARSAGLPTGRWSSHDLRKLVRVCWTFQGANTDAAEALLNHAQSALLKAYMQEKPLEQMRAVLEVWHGQGTANCPGLNLSNRLPRGAF